MINPGLDGKIILITGANHGIGAATAKPFAAQGAGVFITYFGQPSPADAMEAVKRIGGRVEAWEADLADPAVITRLFDRAENALGPVDVLVNNAAHSERDTFLPEDHAGMNIQGKQIQSVTSSTHDRHFVVNSRAPALLMAEYTRRYFKRGAKWGRIVNVSTEGAPGYRDEVSYWASKNALESYSRGTRPIWRDGQHHFSGCYTDGLDP